MPGGSAQGLIFRADGINVLDDQKTVPEHSEPIAGNETLWSDTITTRNLNRNKYPLLSHRSRQRQRLYAMGLSTCLSVSLSVQYAKTRFSKKTISNLHCMHGLVTTYKKLYVGYSKNPLLDP